MSAQSPASDISPRAHASSVAVTYPSHHHHPPTPSEAHILASMSRDTGIMEFTQPQYRQQQPPAPRSVKFELVEDSHQYRARIPMRVQIYPHDTTESIISTVKNFYGLYPTPTSCPGVSFEDDQGNTIIGRYENFRHNSVVYVRVRDGPPTPGPHATIAGQSGAQSYYTQDGYSVHGPQQQAQHMSRPGSRSSRRRSVSPGSVNGRRSASASTSSKNARPRSSKNRGPGSQTHGDTQNENLNGYSSGDNAPGSSSGKPKEQIGSTEISLDNIVEGGRRKRAKFESSVSYSTEDSRELIRASRGLVANSNNFRSCLSSHLLKCLLRYLTPLCPRLVELSITEQPSRLCHRAKIPSQIRGCYNPRRVTTTDMAVWAHILRL